MFQNRSPNYDIHAEVIHRTTEFVFCAQGNSSKSPRVERSIRWERPFCNWFKLNTDGSALGNPGTAGGGGILRSDSGLWIQAFSRSIGKTTSFLAELWALRDGLIMCLNLRISALEVEIDAQAVVELMNNDNTSNATNSSLVADCRLLISQIPQIKVSHCYREANAYADALARIGSLQDSDMLYYDSPLSNLLEFYLVDLYGLFHFRFCPDFDVIASVS